MITRRHAAAFLLLLFAPGAGATTYTWPGAAPCAAQLQACIDGVPNGARIEIATNAPIAEDVSLYDRSLTLTAAAGWLPRFGSGHWLSVTSSAIAGDLTVSVSHLGFSDGYVFANYNGGGTANYDFEYLTLTRIGSDIGNYLEVDANGGTVNATLYGNRLRGVPSSLNRGLIQLVDAGAVLNANVYYNEVTGSATEAVPGAGIFAEMHAYAATAATGTIKLHGNTVRGGFYRAGIFVSEGLFASTASSITARVYNNVVVGVNAADGSGGIGFVVNDGSIDAQAVNNTVTRCMYGIAATRWSGGGDSAGITGVVENNLVAGYDGLDFAASLTSLPTNDYNLLNVTTNSVAQGAHTITAPARLVLDTQPRLEPDSPAIDAADNALLGFGLILNGLPTDDADGLRRFKGAASHADIGAYEFGDTGFTHVARTDTISGHITTIDNAALDGDAGALVFAAPNFSAGGASYDHPFGAYYSSSHWSLFSQDIAPMPANVAFDVLVPAAGGGAFVHVSSAASVTANQTAISDSSTDNLADRIVLVTQNWTAGGSALYNAHPVGVYYADASWHVANLDGAAMQANLGFNVYAQEPSPNAFRVVAGAANLDGNGLRIDHPLLDGTACARPQVTRLGSGTPAVTHHYDLYYLDSKWHIYGYSNSIAPGDTFDVLVDPAQVFDCTDRIFADAFE